MQQHPDISPHPVKHWLLALLAVCIILLAVALALLALYRFENPLVTIVSFIFGIVGTTIGILATPPFREPLQLLLNLLHTFVSAIWNWIVSSGRDLSRWTKRRLHLRWNYILIFLALATTLFSSLNLLHTPNNVVRSCQDGKNVLYITKENDGEDIGISNGSGCEFFTRNNGITNAQQAEQDIYKQNPPLTLPHITLIVSTMLTGTNEASLSGGASILQGADIAQQEYNRIVDTTNKHLGAHQLPLLPLRLLIANAGSNEGYAALIARQIEQLVQQDPSIIGVMGWPFSTGNARDALQILEKEHIPSVSPSLSSDLFTAISPYFFRVIPPDEYQAGVGASFLEKQGVTHVVVCVDYHNDYSSSLAHSFIAAFSSKSGNTITIESYPRGALSQAVDPAGMNASMLGRQIMKDLAGNPIKTEAVYFAGYADDLAPLKGYLSSGQDAQVVVMGGDGLDEYIDPNIAYYANYNDIYFTDFSAPQIWESYPKQPCLLADYQATFDPNHVSHTLGFTFAENDAILAYDATTAFLVAYMHLPDRLRSNPNLDAIKNQLTQTSFLGASGQITLGSTGDPVDKVVYLKHIENNTDPPVLLSPSPASGTLYSSQSLNFPLCP